MRVETFSYRSMTGWSVTSFPVTASGSTLVLAFGASGLLSQPKPFEELRAAYPTAVIIGCSTAGEIHGTELRDDSLTVSVVGFSQTGLRLASATVGTAADSFRAGRKMAASLRASDLRILFVLSDGLSVNGSELVRGLQEVVGPEVVVTGGLAGDGARFQRTWVLVDGVPTERALVAVGFYGDSVGVSHGSRGGWDIFGPERIVTRSTGSVVSELDGRPALALYKTYLGDRANGLPATALLFPLALRVSSGSEKLLVRTILGVDEETQSLTFAGDVPEGSLVQLMRANFDRLIEGAAEAARAAQSPPGRVSLSVAISCVGRRLVLGERAEEEIEAAAEELAKGTELLGFYSYGEISPFGPGERSDLHNQTMTITTLWERD